MLRSSQMTFRGLGSPTYSLFAFGTAALIALFLQKFVGTVLVPPFIAAILLGAIAGIAAWFINAAVMRAMLRPE